jgi:phosphopantetheinyl transferase (holo-ACP synthase)
MGIPGIGIGHFFQDIEIIPDRFKPTITFYGWINKICDKRRINRFFVSLSASSQKAIALVVLSAFEGKIEKRTKNQ